jgi:hypothetical protein
MTHLVHARRHRKIQQDRPQSKHILSIVVLPGGFLHTWKDATRGITLLTSWITSASLLNILPKTFDHFISLISMKQHSIPLTSFVAIKVTITTKPTITLRNAETWLARLADIAERNPIKLPTRVDAATPDNSSWKRYGHNVEKHTYTKWDSVENCMKMLVIPQDPQGDLQNRTLVCGHDDWLSGEG